MKRLPFVMLALMMPVAMHATTFTVTVDVTQDGEDYLLLTGNTLEWEHISLFANGGVTGGSVSETNAFGSTGAVTNPYILVSGTDSANSGLNFTNSDWYNGIQGLSCSSGLTCPYFDVNNGYGTFEFTLPSPYTLTGIVGNVSLSTLICPAQTGSPATACGGGDALPTITQGSTTKVDINDVPDGGQHEFEVQLTWTVEGGTVPEPASIGLMGLGLAAIGLLGRRLRS